MTVLNDILNKLPADAAIESTSYEGANIVIYTKNKTFFAQGGDIIRALVSEVKKRIDLRADGSLRMGTKEAEKLVREIIPKEADIHQILFEPARSLLTIEVKKPGLAIGKDGDNLKKIKEETFWTPIVRRDSVIPSKITTNIRNVLFTDSEDRKKFLHKVGQRIYEQQLSTSEEMWVRITALGAGRQVGRSCFLLQTPESKILLDCGVNVAAHGKYQFPYLNAPEFRIDELDAVIISHAHLDHSGFLPFLFKMGYRGPVYLTEPTRDTTALLLLDYIQVNQSNSKTPLFASADIKEAIKHTISLEYGEVTDITPDVRLTFYNAGHILGSCLVHLHIGDGYHNFMYTGDFKVRDSRLFDGASMQFPRLETLMMESTYGLPNDTMPSREDSEANIEKIIKETLARKGKVLIPSLGVGRSQEIMLVLENIAREEKLDFKVYLDGMVWDVAALHNAYPRFLNKDVRDKIFYEGQDPFLSPIFTRVGSGKERQEAIEGGPCVFIATSGMLTGGPSLEYFKKLGDNPKNSMIFVNYQGEGSLGKKIQSGASEVQVDNEFVKVKIELHTISGLSGHCDRIELMEYIQKVKPRPRKVIIVHGEQSKTLDLASSIHKSFRVETTAPRNLETIRLR
ncbi:MAG: beta-CASP ribonuclease aCPSF1 [DPANN group archaeon]|nr:beta-CASP ribonuclease aCPSF1 [DPANN group archaeon]